MGRPRQIITCPRAAARPLWPLPRVVCAARRGVCRTPACALGMCQPWYLAYRMCVSVFRFRRLTFVRSGFVTYVSTCCSVSYMDMALCTRTCAS